MTSRESAYVPPETDPSASSGLLAPVEQAPELPSAEPTGAALHREEQSGERSAASEQERPVVQQGAAEEPTGDFTDDQRMVTVRMRVRRAPRLGRFVAAGVVLGMVIGVVIGLLPAQGGGEGVNPDLQYEPASIVAFWTALTGLVGALVGAAVALVFEKRS